MPDGDHWFPAVDVATELGYANTRAAVARHVPAEQTRRLSLVLQSVSPRDALSRFAGHSLKKSNLMVTVKGLVRLVNGSTKPESEAFENWVTEVIVSVQRDGVYTLRQAEIQPADPQTPTAYAMPEQVADAIVRLEERSVRSDEELAALTRDANRLRWDQVSVLRTIAEAQQRSVVAMQNLVRDQTRSLDRVADVLERIADGLPPRPAPPAEAALTADQLLAAWRERLTITDDVWAVAVLLAPPLAEDGEARISVAALAARTGLSEARVHDALRFLLRRQAIRQTGNTPDGAPIYQVHHP
ncbi:Bro-N domain-containing protein [Streptomyces sp. B6B3]|uniref:BRO-N domain-containing protein n=1 Tax=Streptomyces sp. B6B3 TaxID=3153570 RepID=UPI00325E253B